MRRSDPVHPTLVRRRPRLLAWAAGLVLVLGMAVFGWTQLAGWPDLSPVKFADAQTSEETETQPETTVPDGRMPRLERLMVTEGEEATYNNSISRQAAEWGLETCMDQVALVSDFLTTNQNYTALSQRGTREPEREIFSATIAARDGAGLDSISSFIAAPLEGGRCQSSYQTVAAFPSPCGEVASTQFASFSEQLAFGDHVEARHNGRGSYVYFLPLGDTACVIVKSQTIR